MKTLKEVTNGWEGFWAKETIQLIDGENNMYAVTYTSGTTHKVQTYRTLKGAEKRFNQLDQVMVKKDLQTA